MILLETSSCQADQSVEFGDSVHEHEEYKPCTCTLEQDTLLVTQRREWLKFQVSENGELYCNHHQEGQVSKTICVQCMNLHII